jgi:hypothetical protein
VCTVKGFFWGTMGNRGDGSDGFLLVVLGEEIDNFLVSDTKCIIETGIQISMVILVRRNYTIPLVVHGKEVY